MLKAVIFDIDGTLIDSVDLHAQSWLETFERFGVQARFADVRRHMEGADKLIPAFVPAEMPNGLRKQIEEFRSQLFKQRISLQGEAVSKGEGAVRAHKSQSAASLCSPRHVPPARSTKIRRLLVSQT